MRKTIFLFVLRTHSVLSLRLEKKQQKYILSRHFFGGSVAKGKHLIFYSMPNVIILRNKNLYHHAYIRIKAGQYRTWQLERHGVDCINTSLQCAIIEQKDKQALNYNYFTVLFSQWLLSHWNGLLIFSGAELSKQACLNNKTMTGELYLPVYNNNVCIYDCANINCKVFMHCKTYSYLTIC